MTTETAPPIDEDVAAELMFDARVEQFKETREAIEAVLAVWDRSLPGHPLCSQVREALADTDPSTYLERFRQYAAETGRS